tara:strand:+ start:2142 stop:3389 length:1248 start_codon:yes stop_codon:yes gene_type:complete
MKKSKKKIAIIGSGISGLYLAWKISKDFDVTIYEKNNYFGGHSNTREVNLKKKILVDTGFIVFNKKNYPNFTNFLKNLKVPIKKSNMSFAVDIQNKNFCYSSSLKGIFIQKKNILKINFWLMLIEIIIFYKFASKKINKNNYLTLEEFLNKKNYSDTFKKNHIYPMASAIWSTKKKIVNKIPIYAFIKFFTNHGLFKFYNRPTWYTVDGGSKCYIKKVLKKTQAKFKKNLKVKKLEVKNKKILVYTNKSKKSYDNVICACHADEASNITKKINPEASNLLQKFKYTKNKIYLHSDEKLMPNNKKIWSSWNYLSISKNKKIYSFFTYWMNKLQNIDKNYPFFLTLNPPIKPKKIFYKTIYTHPIFTKESMEIPNKIDKIQGKNGVWFCGSYFSYGFHEDAINSSIKVAKLIYNEAS